MFGRNKFYIKLVKVQNDCTKSVNFLSKHNNKLIHVLAYYIERRLDGDDESINLLLFLYHSFHLLESVHPCRLVFFFGKLPVNVRGNAIRGNNLFIPSFVSTLYYFVCINKNVF